MNNRNKSQSMIYPNLSAPETFCDQCASVWESALSLQIVAPSKLSNMLLFAVELVEDSARILESLLYPVSSIPVQIATEPRLPGFVSNRSLVLACSLPGIEREVLECLDTSLARGAYVVCISTESRVTDFAKSAKIPFYMLPRSFIPYASNGYLFIPMLASLVRTNLIDDQTSVLTEALTILRRDLKRFAIGATPAENLALKISKLLADRFILVLGASPLTSSVAFHWSRQLASVAGWTVTWDTLPDYPEGGLAGALHWGTRRLAVITLRSDEDHPGIARRFHDLRSDLIRKGAVVEEVWATGNSSLAQTLSLLVLGDYVSEYLKLVRPEAINQSSSQN